MRNIHYFCLTWFLSIILINPAIGLDSHKNNPLKQAEYFTCSMHPQVRLNDPDARCPICGMSLVPVYGVSDASKTDTDKQLTMSATAKKLADIQTTLVKRTYPVLEVKLFGQVDFDETQIADISAYFPGRIEKLFVNYEGITVRKGDHLADIYSPDLITAQQELKEALHAVKLAKKGANYTRLAAQENLTAARDKLRLWGLSRQQIKQLEQAKHLTERMTIYSPQNGVVIEQNVQEGKYLKTGERIYRVASLERLWIKLEAYESQLPWLRYGQEVTFSSDAHPGEIFKGKISFISPIIDRKKRTAAVRVNIQNPKLQLKPGLFVRATVAARIAGYGNVIDKSLRGKWIGPMHPEVIRDEPGTCHICGMSLVPAESLGYINETQNIAPLVIPSTAPLITGKRAIVFVNVPNQPKPTYESREIILGPKAGNVYIVKSGLNLNEEVVTHGAFKIDSAMQITAKPSMMNTSPSDTLTAPVTNDAHHHHHH